MSRNPDFDNALEIMKDIHDKKNHDYASDNNPFANFEVVARITGLPVDTVFKVLLAVKEARLEELLSSDKTPNFESISDTYKDQAVYAALRYSYKLKAERIQVKK